MPYKNANQEIYQAAYRAAHREERRANGRTYYANHKKEVKAKQAIYRSTHRAARNATNAVYYTSHKEEYKILLAAWYARNREELKAKRAVYRASHIEAASLRSARRLARKRSLPDTLTLAQWNSIKRAYGFKCAYCGAKSKKLTKDHVVPLIQGGGTTASNIVPACQGCNSRKHTSAPPLIPALRLLL